MEPSSYTSSLRVLSGILLWILFTPLWVPMLIVFSIWKTCVVLAAKCFKPHLIPISYNDSYFALYSCAEQPLMSVGVAFRIQGRVETEQLMKRFKECFLTEESKDKYQNLYCYFEKFGGYVFKRRVEKLIVENHFIEKTLPRGMDPEDFLGKWIVTDTYRHKPEGQPCWQVIILRRGSEYDYEETMVSIKLHHGMIDGYSLVHMVDKLTGGKSPYLLPNPDNESLLTKLKHLAQGATLILEKLLKVITSGDLITQGNPFETNWVMSFTTLDLDMIKNIRRKTKTKFATIMMAAATGALKRFYMEDKRMRRESLPKQVWVESPLGIPKHPAMGDGTFCNHFAAGLFAAPMKTDDRMHRLQSLDKDFLDFQLHSGLLVVKWLLFGFYWLQPACVLKVYTNYVLYLFRFSVLYSGLMTSAKKVCLVGHPVGNIYFLQATTSAFPCVFWFSFSLALFFMSSTYAGKLDVSFHASNRLAMNKQELQRLVNVHFKAELEEMNKEFSQEKHKSTVVDVSTVGS